MTFEEALKLMREGKSIKRRDWIYVYPGELGDSEQFLTKNDIMAEDWQDASDFDIDEPAGEGT